MVTLSATTLTGIINTSLTATIAENIIDSALNKITSYGYELTALDGTAGTKSKTVTQQELGWVQTVAVAIYAHDYSNEGADSRSDSIGGLGGNANAANPDELAEKAAKQLNQTDWGGAFV